MRKTRLFLIAVALVAITGLTYWGGKQLFIRAFAQADLGVRPFVAERIQYFVENGKEVVTVRETISRRRDGGEERTEHFYNADGSPGLTMRRVDLPNGYVGMIIDSIRAKATGTKPALSVAQAKQALLHPPAGCVSPVVGSVNGGYEFEKSEGTEQLFGLTAIKVTHEFDGGLQRQTLWRFPDFACASLQGLLEKRTDLGSPWQTVAGSKLTSLIGVDPPQESFRPWDAYSEMKPSDLKRTYFQSAGVNATSCPQCFKDDTAGDATYRAWNGQ